MTDDMDLSAEDISGLDYAAVILPKTRFVSCKAQETDFYRAVLYGCNFSGADLQRANMFGADLRWVNFSGADLRGAYMAFASMRNAIMDGAVYNERTVWPDGFTPTARMVRKK